MEERLNFQLTEIPGNMYTYTYISYLRKFQQFLDIFRYVHVWGTISFTFPGHRVDNISCTFLVRFLKTCNMFTLQGVARYTNFYIKINCVAMRHNCNGLSHVVKGAWPHTCYFAKHLRNNYLTNKDKLHVYTCIYKTQLLQCVTCCQRNMYPHTYVCNWHYDN